MVKQLIQSDIFINYSIQLITDTETLFILEQGLREAIYHKI